VVELATLAAAIAALDFKNCRRVCPPFNNSCDISTELR